MALKDRPGSVMSLGFLLWGPALILFITIMAPASGQEFDRGTIGQKLSLDIYLYETGQTLVAGYVENPMSLSFLKPPRYTAIPPNMLPDMLPDMSLITSTRTIPASYMPGLMP